ncbi:MAG: outer membrane protein assembly factor BamC [Alteromonadaceae bacterium]|nr:outer membrane protein assembly factor BamC [Alteromonadaceae bacterium]
MSRRIFIFLLLSLSLSACSSVDNAKRALGDFDYAKASEAKELIVPKGLDKPVYANKYALATDINTNGPVGDKVDIRAPSLVLPTAASSRVELNSTTAKIWFDKAIEDKDLKDFILGALKGKVIDDGVEFDVVNEQKNLYESSWYHKTKESGFWLWSYTDTLKSMRFEYQLETKPHGRSVALLVKLIDFKDKDGSTKMDPIEQQRAEVAMLNSIIGHVDYMYRKNRREHHLLLATQKIVTIGKNSANESSYIIELEKDYLWDNLPAFFEKYGFTLDDLNETKSIYYVTFVKPENSLWDSIWGDSKAIIDLTNAQYQFKLTAVGKKTALTIYDKEGKPLSAETLLHIFDVMEPALSFRD